MSIEKKIEDLIDALERNTQAITAFNSVDRTVQEILDKNIERAAEIEKIDQTSEYQRGLDHEVQESYAQAEAAYEALKYEDLVTAFRQFIGKHGRDKAAEVLTSFGITGKLTQDQLPEDKYQAFLDALK